MSILHEFLVAVIVVLLVILFWLVQLNLTLTQARFMEVCQTRTVLRVLGACPEE